MMPRAGERPIVCGPFLIRRALVRVFGRFGLALVFVALAAVVGVTPSSAATAPAAQNAVGASTFTGQVVVGHSAVITAGQRLGSYLPPAGIVVATGIAANTGARTFGSLGASDLRAAAQVADSNGLTQVGRALQKHSGREGSVFNGFSSGTATARNEQGLQVLDEILSDPSGRTEVLNRVTNIWDSTGRGVRFGNDGSFMGFLEPLG